MLLAWPLARRGVGRRRSWIMLSRRMRGRVLALAGRLVGRRGSRVVTAVVFSCRRSLLGRLLLTIIASLARTFLGRIRGPGVSGLRHGGWKLH